MAKKARILFLDRGNSGRSQLAHALARHIGSRSFEPFSAGTYPAQAIHPEVLQTLERYRIPSDGLRPKDLSTYAGQEFDYVICLCDRELEQPIAFPGADVICWRFPDPAKVPEGRVQQRAFEDTYRGLERRIRLLMVIVDPRRPAPHPPNQASAAAL